MPKKQPGRLFQAALFAALAVAVVAELFVPFSEFPWFKDAPIAKLTNVERPQPHHLYWPDLDVDLAVESIRHPDKFPLVARSGI